jgi:hypothetical protein
VKKAVAYRLTPVYEVEPGQIATAALINCMATGRMLSGMGGGGEYLAPEVVESLRASGTARVVCDAALFERMLDLAQRAATGEDVARSAAAIVEEVHADRA